MHERTQDAITYAVSYTHLDVYKRQNPLLFIPVYPYCRELTNTFGSYFMFTVLAFNFFRHFIYQTYSIFNHFQKSLFYLMCS